MDATGRVGYAIGMDSWAQDGMSEITDPMRASNILIVDDNPTNVVLLEAILDEAGFENVFSTTDPTQVEGMYRDNRIDLILLDIRMPVMSGHDVMARLRETAEDDYIPVLVITAQSDDETRMKALKHGAKDFITKPFDQKEVLHRIANLLEVRMLYNERTSRAEGLETEILTCSIELGEREAHMNGILESTSEIIITATPDGAIETFNRAAERTFGYEQREAHTLNVADLVKHSNLTKVVGTFETKGLRKDGERFPMELSVSPMSAGERDWLVITGRDITKRKKAEKELYWLANHDQVTELPNRSMITKALVQSIGGGAGAGEGAILFLALKGHQRVSDILGHDIGKKLLRAAGHRLADEIGRSGLVGAWGGGEFVVALDGLVSETDVAAMADKIRDAIENPFEIEGNELNLDCIIGASLYPFDSDEPLTLIKNASIAMYDGKKSGARGTTFFTPRMDDIASERHMIERELRHAIDRDELRLFYQPKIDLDTKGVMGMEALIRWNNQEMGMVSPGQFIPLAEETGLIVPIGEWVLRTACADTKGWIDMGYDDLQVAVNFSGRQFDAYNVSDLVRDVLTETGLPPEALEAEVTESALVKEAERAREILDDLRGLGVAVAIDDFGTGYSSLGQLQQFPLTILKIDQSFVQNVTENEDDAAIARMIVDMARNLGLKVVAEGIETEAHAAFLKALNCHLGQGYLYSRPLPSDEFEAYLKESRG